MPELTTRERLQPSLLDRLTDDEPGKKVESRDKRVLHLKQLRASVIRDLSWLLNTGDLRSCHDLDDWPELAHSVLNYGVADLTGLTASGVDITEVERRFRQSILDFEPRILPKTLRVRAIVAEDRMNRNALTFEIEGELWADPAPLRLLLQTEVDLETGSVQVTDQGAR